MSGDDLPPTTWGAGVDAEQLTTLRLRKGREALERGEGSLALAEAEELLDTAPGQEDALWLSGEAAFELGDVHTAALALQTLVDRRPLAAEAWSLLARCRLDRAEFDAANDAATRCLQLQPELAHDLAQAHFVLGIVARQRGRPEAGDHLAQASERDPGCFARGPTVEPKRWVAALPLAIELLPDELRAIFAHVEIDLRDHPRAELLEHSSDPLSPLIPCLVLPPLPPPGLPPARIAIFTDNLRAADPGKGALARALGEALTDLGGLWMDVDLEEGPFSEE